LPEGVEGSDQRGFEDRKIVDGYVGEFGEERGLVILYSI
jgi:hypothetical protein